MTGKNCELDMKESDGVLEIRLGGEIDHHNAVIVRTRIDELISQIHPKKTVIDLAGIEFMDSSGLGLIMGRYALIQKIGGDFFVKNPNERVVKIFELAGFDKIISIEGIKKIEKSMPLATKKKRKKQRREKNDDHR